MVATVPDYRDTSGTSGTSQPQPMSFRGTSQQRSSEYTFPPSLQLRGTNSISGVKRSPASRLFGKLASEDFQVMRSSIVLFPLCFVDTIDEQRFYNRIVQTFQIRARIAAFASFIFFATYWVITALCLKFRTFPSAGELSVIVYSIAMGGIVLSSVVPYIASSVTVFKGHIETSLYISVLVTAICVGGWMVLNALEEYSGNVLAIVQFQRTKIWVNVYTYVLPFWSCMLMDIVMQARFAIHVANFGIFTACSVAQTAIFVQKASKSAKINIGQKNFMIVTTSLDCIFALCINMLLFIGRWFLELQERIEFLRRMRAIDQIRRLKEANANKKRKKGATIVEDVMSLVEKVIATIDEVLVEFNLPSLAEGAELLKQCQQILTDTDNLYSVRYRSKGQGEEEEAMEEQFFQIYTDQRYARLPTRVRFGEVTGIQYDVNAAARDISRSGALEKNATVRSFGLLNLHDGQKKQFLIEPYAPPPTLAAEEIMRIGRDWETDILRLGRMYENVLLEVGYALLAEKIDYIRASQICLLNYLHRLQSCYPDNPYHNSTHGAAVAHATSCFMKMLYIHEAADHTSVNDIAIIIAALGHDAGHPARNNQFFVNSLDSLALLYNDASVLENVHSAITFKCLESAGCNIFADVTPEVFRGIRKRIIELILSTDMGQHFEAVSRFRLRRQASGFNYLQDLDDMWLVIRMCIKCADLSHALVDWTQHLDWSLRVVEEFYQQGDNETALGLTVSPLCDRSTHKDFAKSQKGFIEFVVQPLLTQMEELTNGGAIEVECGRRLTYNKYRWEEWAKEQYAPVIPDEYCNMKTKAFHCIETLVLLFAKGQRLVPFGACLQQDLLMDKSLMIEDAQDLDVGVGGSDEANTSAGQERSSDDTPPNKNDDPEDDEEPTDQAEPPRQSGSVA